MKIFSTAAEIAESLAELKLQGKTIGFVPTMGALHQGHLALLEKARLENDITVVSIFVNPLQFNNPEDFDRYPKREEEDTRLLEAAGCDLLFYPSVAEVYPENIKEQFELGALDESLEGKFRPGHFEGVASVIKRFFSILPVDKAYFGLKDYQQYLVVKQIALQFFPSVEIIGVPTIRDHRGIALSSRNLRLSEAALEKVAAVPALLRELKIRKISAAPADLKAWFEEAIKAYPELSLEYIEIADEKTLQPLQVFTPGAGARVLVAFYCEGIRLIDNMEL